MNNIICEVVHSIRNKEKINVDGYLMVKDKNRKIYIIGVVKTVKHYNAMGEQLLY